MPMLRFSRLVVLGILAILHSCTACVAFELQEAAGSEVIDFRSSVAPILERRCGGCHAGLHAKAGFEIDDAEAVLGYIEPGDVQGSSLWTDYLNAESAHSDPSTLVMPLNGPLRPQELSMIQNWIEQGADWPENFRFISTTGIPTIPRETAEPEGLFQRIAAFSGYFHPAVVHFPIALLIFGGAAAGLSFLTGGRAVYVAYYCLVWGTLFAILAAYMGWCLAAEKGYPAWTTVPSSESIEASAAVYRHRWLGTASTVLAMVVTIVASIAIRKPKSNLRHVWRVGLMVIALMVSIAGHQGGELVYGDIIHKAFDRLSGK